MQITAEEFMDQNPDVDITISGGGSRVGIAVFIDKIADIIRSSRRIPANIKMKQIDSQTAKPSGGSKLEKLLVGRTVSVRINQLWLYSVTPIPEPLKFSTNLS